MCPVTDPDLVHRMLEEFREIARKQDEKLEAFRAEVNQQFAGMNRRFDEMRRDHDSSSKHFFNEDARLSTEISAVRGAYDGIEPKQAQLEDRVERCEHEIEELKKRDDS